MMVVFADLDDTLFQTLRKLPPEAQTGLTPATLGRDGQPHSFQTAAQRTLLELLQARAMVIPVTGRDPAAMSRVLLPFESWRVCDHGLTILDAAGQPEPQWQRLVQAQLEPLQAELAAFTESIRPQAEALGCRLTIYEAHGLPFMTVLKHPQLDMAALAQAQARCEDALPKDHALQVIANANNVSLLPRALGKREAVRYLRQTYFAGAVLTLGLGDSISDLAFMSECDFALTPQRGQLLRTLAQHPLPQR